MAKAKKKVAKKKVVKKKLPAKKKGASRKAASRTKAAAKKKIAKKKGAAQGVSRSGAAPKKKTPSAPGEKAVPSRRIAPPAGPEGAPKISTKLATPERLTPTVKAAAALPVPPATKEPVRPDDFLPRPAIGEPSPAESEE